MKAQEQFTIKILSAISQIISDEENENYIDPEYLEENATDFFHALFNLAPTAIYREMTSEDKNILQCNYLANQLIYQNK